MMIALPLMLPAVAPLPVLAMPTAPVVSFEDMLADIAPQPVIPGSVAPIKVAANHLQLDTLGEPASSDVSVPDRVSVTGPEAVYPPVAEAFEAMPAPELMVAAQIIAVAAQLAPSSAKPQNDPEQAETTANEIGLVTQHVSSPTPHQRAAVEPTSFTLPTIATVANIQPQILQELDLARDLAWIGNLAQDIVAASDDRDHLSFRLMPRALGLLDVDLSRSPEGLHIEFTATTERATQIIAAEQPRLIEELRQSGIKTTGTDLPSGQHPHSQRGHPPPRSNPPFFNSPTRSAKPTNRPDGRFA